MVGNLIQLHAMLAGKSSVLSPEHGHYVKHDVVRKKHILRNNAKQRRRSVSRCAHCRPPAGHLPTDTVLQGMTSELHVNGLKTVRLGYPLLSCSSFVLVHQGDKSILPRYIEIDSLSEEIQDLLLEQAVSIVPTHNRHWGFYSAYFMVPKKMAGFKLIFLHILNQCIA